MRRTASILEQYLDEGDYEYLEGRTDKDVAFLTWRADKYGNEIHRGDSYVIPNGRIVVQTVHSVRKRPE